MAKLILVRHGQSRWNLSNRFTGWVDAPLSLQGIREAQAAAEKLKDVPIDVCFTSTLQRAQATLAIILASQGKVGIFQHGPGRLTDWAHYTELAEEGQMPVYVSEKINERYYGGLQGLNKDAARKKWGEEQVHLWRRSYDVPPPDGECLKDVCERVRPYFEGKIMPQLKKGRNVLVSAHGNSLRAMIKDIEGISDEQIPLLELVTGEPIIYEYKNGRLVKEG